MAQVGGQELRLVVVTGMGPVFLLDETRERWNRAEERERDTAGLIEGAGPCGPLAFAQQPITAEGVDETMPGFALHDRVMIV